MAARDRFASLRDAFPVLARVAYLNAGTNGPVAARATAAACELLAREERDGRGEMAFFDALEQLAEGLRADYAARLGARPADVALTTSTTDGVARVLAALRLERGAEVLTSDEEHPGVYGPLLGQARARGIAVRTAPLARIAEAVTARTRLVVCSHVSWRSGAVAPAELAQVDVPVLLDGAQGVGAVPVDVEALGADFYAGPGQKWLCGPVGTGMLYVAPRARPLLEPACPGYVNLAEPNRGLAAEPHDDARAFDAPALPAAALAHARATLALLGEAGWPELHARAHALAARAADELCARGREVLPRGATTLVTWRERDAARAVERLAARDVIVRSLPGEELVRASFGGWSDERDLERLLDALPD